MNLTTDRAQGIAIVRVGETRLMYPLLADFSGAVMSLLTGGDKKVISTVGHYSIRRRSLKMDLTATTAPRRARWPGVNKRRNDDDMSRHNFSRVFGRGRLKSFGVYHAQIKTTPGRIVLGLAPPGARALYHEVHGPKARALVRGQESRDQPPIVADGRREEGVPRRKPVPQPSEVRERQARGVSAKVREILMACWPVGLLACLCP